MGYVGKKCRLSFLSSLICVFFFLFSGPENESDNLMDATIPTTELYCQAPEMLSSWKKPETMVISLGVD